MDSPTQVWAFCLACPRDYTHACHGHGEFLAQTPDDGTVSVDALVASVIARAFLALRMTSRSWAFFLGPSLIA